MLKNCFEICWKHWLHCFMVHVSRHLFVQIANIPISISIQAICFVLLLYTYVFCAKESIDIEYLFVNAVYSISHCTSNEHQIWHCLVCDFIKCKLVRWIFVLSANHKPNHKIHQEFFFCLKKETARQREREIKYFYRINNARISLLGLKRNTSSSLLFLHWHSEWWFCVWQRWNTPGRFLSMCEWACVCVYVDGLIYYLAATAMEYHKSIQWHWL